jgi:hypothetical protein
MVFIAIQAVRRWRNHNLRWISLVFGIMPALITRVLRLRKRYLEDYLIILRKFLICFQIARVFESKRYELFARDLQDAGIPRILAHKNALPARGLYTGRTDGD